MTVYSRSDRTSMGGVPGCDQEHFPPAGFPPGKAWPLTCPVHEAWIKGDRKSKILMHKIEGGRVVGQERVADMEPGWGTTPETVPLTPDEERADSHYRETAQSQISAMNALGIAISNGLQIPPEMMYLLRKQLPADMIIPGTKVCAGGHDAPAGSQFCPECGVSMAARGAITPPGEPAAVDLARLHPQTLRKMCRDHVPPLPDKGSKDVLIGRLQAA